MRNRLVGAFAAAAIASAALVACSPPNENPSDIAVTDQENPTNTFENSGDASGENGTSSEETSAEETATNGGEANGQEPVAQ
ncbi:hypothetical protein [uncultured Corynebacterium sp.]|uniref:hypothetical protein n=1 Tax=uncultured Corynebacterium sp. TaxID=159447 RepID=UPI002625FD29|nr:hypothetical protein [uncultured Corynebacterium sp.]